MPKNEPRPDGAAPKDEEEALFDRFYQRLRDAGLLVSETVTRAAGSVAGAAGDAAGAVGSALQGVSYAAETARDFVDDQASKLSSDIDEVVTNIIDRRKSERVAQIMFRVPDDLRLQLKHLSLETNKNMDVLLIQAVVDLLAKHGRGPLVSRRPETKD